MSVIDQIDSTLADTLQNRIGVSVNRCYQCGKCSAGCPAASEMDIAPSVIIHLLQTKNVASEAKVLGSYSIWLCLACQTCNTRCPMEVDLPKIMDILRSESLRRRAIHSRAKDIVAFHKSFIGTIRHLGRMWEVGLIAEYKIRTRHIWQDVLLAPSMFMKGKLSLLPSFHRKSLSNIFAKADRGTESAK